MKNEFAVVETAEGGAPQINDIIPVSQCRHTAMPSKISAASVKSCAIPLNSEMFEYFQRGEETYKVLQESIPNILVKLDPTTKELVIKVLFIDEIIRAKFPPFPVLLNQRDQEGGHPEGCVHVQ